jgi:predicted DNA-binding transcriptional regulator AlpA
MRPPDSARAPGREPEEPVSDAGGRHDGQSVPGAVAFVDARTAARVHGVGARSWARWSVSGRVPRPVRLGRRVLWSVAELEDWARAGCPARERWEAIRAGGTR